MCLRHVFMRVWVIGCTHFSAVLALGALSGAQVLTWRVALGMYNGCLGAGPREFPPVSPLRLVWARSARPKC